MGGDYMIITKFVPLIGIEIDKKKAGKIYNCTVQGEPSNRKFYITWKNDGMIMKKMKYGIGISYAILNKLEIHNVKDIMIKYQLKNMEFEYYHATCEEFSKSKLEYCNGSDLQKFIPLSILKTRIVDFKVKG